MSNILEVAKKAGVSAATVSRVINNTGVVSEETAQRVYQAIEELHYSPNLLGRNLRRAKTGLVVIVLPTIENVFFSTIVKGIEDVGHENGYNVLISTMRNAEGESGESRMETYLNLIRNKFADGVIFVSNNLEQYHRKVKVNIPLVICCEYNDNISVPQIVIDDEQAGFDMTSHLISLGHKRIAFIGAGENSYTSGKRQEGYVRALKTHHLPIQKEYLCRGDYSFSNAKDITKSLLMLSERPTALFTVSDVMAMGAVRAAQEKGLCIPEEFAVGGFDNISFSRMFYPEITTVSQPRYEMGRKAMGTLLEMINGKKLQKQSITLPHKLIIRQSTKK